MTAHATPFDPRAGRQRRLIAFLRGAGAVTFALACTALVPGDVGEAARGAMLVVLVLTPLVRVAWLARRWNGRGDRRYVAVAAAIVAIVGSGLAIG